MSKHLYSSASMAQMRASPPEKLKYGGEINFIGNFGHFTAVLQREMVHSIRGNVEAPISLNLHGPDVS